MQKLNSEMSAVEIANVLYSRAKARTTRDEFRPFDLMAEQEQAEFAPMKVGICFQFHYVNLFCRAMQKTKPGTYVVVGGDKPMLSGGKGRRVMEF